jgi:hypothetical protein
LVLIAFIGICFATFAQSGVLNEFVDDGIYGAIEKIIEKRNPHKTHDEIKCIVESFKDDKLVDKFYTADLLFNHQKLEREIEPYLSNVSTKCEWIAFIKTPLGICCVVGLILAMLSIICGLIKCICC